MRVSALIGEQSATDPGGREWTVGVRWLPRQPRWTGWGPGRNRERRQHDVPWLDGAEMLMPDDFPALAVIGAVVVGLILAWLFVLPIAIFALDLLFLLLLTTGTIAARVLFRRPWIVEATTEGEERHWPVVGFRTSRKMVGEVVWALQQGREI